MKLAESRLPGKLSDDDELIYIIKSFGLANTNVFFLLRAYYILSSWDKKTSTDFLISHIYSIEDGERYVTFLQNKKNLVKPESNMVKV